MIPSCYIPDAINRKKDLTEICQFLKVISDQNRLQIIRLLKTGPHCVCQIFPALGISQKLASHHLKQLKKAGLLKEKRVGTFTFYRLDKKSLQSHRQKLNQLIR